MRKLYLFLGLAVLVPVLDVAACGGGDNPGSGGAGANASGGGALPEFNFDLDVVWTLGGQPANAATCMSFGVVTANINVSGTTDPSLHKSFSVDCVQGKVSMKGLSSIAVGVDAFAEGFLLNVAGMSMFATSVNFSPSPSHVVATLDFQLPPPMSTSTSGPGPGSGGSGMGGAGGAGGAGVGGASTTGATTGATSSSTAAASSGTS